MRPPTASTLKVPTSPLDEQITYGADRRVQHQMQNHAA